MDIKAKLVDNFKQKLTEVNLWFIGRRKAVVVIGFSLKDLKSLLPSKFRRIT